VAVLKSAASVLVDTEQAEEGECERTPVAGSLECCVVDAAVHGQHVAQRDGSLRLSDLIGVKVVDTLYQSPIQLAAWQWAVAERVRSVGYC
jgi:hypothetical protein